MASRDQVIHRGRFKVSENFWISWSPTFEEGEEEEKKIKGHRQTGRERDKGQVENRWKQIEINDLNTIKKRRRKKERKKKQRIRGERPVPSHFATCTPATRVEPDRSVLIERKNKQQHGQLKEKPSRKRL